MWNFKKKYWVNTRKNVKIKKKVFNLFKCNMNHINKIKKQKNCIKAVKSLTFKNLKITN